MSVTTETLSLLQGMRISLDGRVDEQTRSLVRAWARAWDELSADWRAAIADLTAQAQDGAWPARGIVVRAERTAKALEASREALLALGENAGVNIVGTLPDLTLEASQWQARLAASQMPAAADPVAMLASFDRVDARALDAVVRRTAGQVTALTRPLADDATEAMARTLIRGVVVGDNPRRAAAEMVRRVEGRFNGGLTRALTIARTEMLDAHREAARAQDAANVDTLRGWQWVATLDTRTCPSCWAQHGSEHPVDEPGPYDHQQGRCARVPLTKSWRDLGFDLDEPPSLVRSGADEFADLSQADQLAVMGRARLDALNAGTPFADLTTRRQTDGWRDSYAPTPVRDLAA